MSGIYISGVEMPKNCYNCQLRFLRCCPIKSQELTEKQTRPNAKRPQDCPLIPVPPHGDLIDQEAYRDEFMDGVYELCIDDPDNYRANAIIDLYDNIPTIIPASEEET